MDATLVAAAKSVQSIQNFINGQGLTDALSLLTADQAVQAARTAIGDSSTSKFPRDRINSAINHLESAHRNYEEVHSGGKFFHRLRRNTIQHSVVLLAFDRDLYVCALLAICYAGLDDRAMVHKWLARGNHVVSRVDEWTMKEMRTIPWWAGPLDLLELNRANMQATDTKKFMHQSDFTSFKKNLEAAFPPY